MIIPDEKDTFLGSKAKEKGKADVWLRRRYR